MNWQAYQEGYEAWSLFHASQWIKKELNPYVLDPISWESWNRGWNANQEGL